MATLRNRRKLAAVTRETQEESLRYGQSRNTSVSRINEEYITEVSEQIEGRVTKKLSQEFSRTESRVLGALSKLDEFLLNQQITTHYGTLPGTFRNTNVENQGTNEDDSQSDPHPEAGISAARLHETLAQKIVVTCDRSYRSNSSLSWHGDRRSRRDSRSLRHGDRRFRRDAQWLWHSDSSSRRDSLLLLWDFLRKIKEGALHKSATISQWEHPCDIWSRPDFVGPSAIGDEQYFCQCQ